MLEKNTGMDDERPGVRPGFESTQLEGSPNLPGPHFPRAKVNKIGNLANSY